MLNNRAKAERISLKLLV